PGKIESDQAVALQCAANFGLIFGCRPDQVCMACNWTRIGALPYNSTVPGRRVSLVPRRLSPWLSESGFRLRLKNKGLHLGEDTASLKRGTSLAPSGNE